MITPPPGVGRTSYLHRVEGHVQAEDGSFRKYRPEESERIAANRARGLLQPATHRMGADGVPVPIPPPPDPEREAKIAEGRRILAEQASKRAAEVAKAEAERRASWSFGRSESEISAEFERLRAARASDAMVADVLGAVGLKEPPNAYTPIVARKPMEFDEEDVLKFAREEFALREKFNRAR